MPAVADTPASVPTLPAATVEVPVQRWRDGVISHTTDQVSEEVPVALTYQGIPFVVMMTSPADLEDLGVGLTLTEGLVRSADEITSVELRNEHESLEVRIGLTAERFAEFLTQRRNLTGRTGCGVCGAETLDQVVRNPAGVGHGITLTRKQLLHALDTLNDYQPWNAQTGSIHAAAWGTAYQGLNVVREDVGRHNALDKVIGSLLRNQVNASTGFVVLTSRASHEMIQKAAIAGISIVIAVSAPTAMAIRLADRCGITLVGFAREHQHVIYTHPERIVD